MENHKKRAITTFHVILLSLFLFILSSCSKDYGDTTYAINFGASNIITSEDMDFANNSDEKPERTYKDPILRSNSNQEIQLKEETSPVEDISNQQSDTEQVIRNRMVAIDAGHQRKGNYNHEPIGPGATMTKPKVSSGTRGVSTKAAEYELTLEISLQLKEALLERGYSVFMIRETHDINISNKERADMANDSGADIFIRIHADSSTNPSVHGVSTLAPSANNPYVANLSNLSTILSQNIVDEVSKYTGARNRGVFLRDDMSGINWCKIPVTILEMGYMSNPNEDKLMQTKEYQQKIVEGILKGIEIYFSNNDN